MNQKKIKSTTYIAVIYWLLAGFLIPVIGGFIVTVILSPLFFISSIRTVAITGGSVGATIFQTVVVALTVWFGAWYGSRFVGRKYIISQPGKMANISVILTAIRIFVPGFLFVSATAIDVISNIFLVIIFYFLSRHYLSRVEDISV